MSESNPDQFDFTNSNTNIGIDCTEVVEGLLTQANNQNSVAINTIANNISSQGKLMETMSSTLNSLLEFMKSSHSKTQTATAPSSSRQGLNVPEGTQPCETGDQLQSRNSSEEDELSSCVSRNNTDGDEISLHPSEILFRKDSQDKHPVCEENTTPLLNKDQVFWENSVLEYDENQSVGKEISSSVVSAAKVMWVKKLKSDQLKERLDKAKIPSNAMFILPKRCNREIWSNTASAQRTHDVKIQKLQGVYAGAIALVLQATANVSSVVHAEGEQTIESINQKANETLSLMKDSLYLLGNVSQELNSLRKQLIKSSLPREYARLIEKGDESSTMLFGDNLTNALEDLQKENKLQGLLKKNRKPEKKRKYESESYSSNYKSPPKAWKGTPQQGQSNYQKGNHHHPHSKSKPHHHSSSKKPKQH